MSKGGQANVEAAVVSAGLRFVRRRRHFQIVVLQKRGSKSERVTKSSSVVQEHGHEQVGG